MDQLYERIWTYMSETEPAPMVRNEEEGLHLVLNGDYAFLWDDPVLQVKKNNKNITYDHDRAQLFNLTYEHIRSFAMINYFWSKK